MIPEFSHSVCEEQPFVGNNTDFLRTPPESCNLKNQPRT